MLKDNVENKIVSNTFKVNLDTPYITIDYSTLYENIVEYENNEYIFKTRSQQSSSLITSNIIINNLNDEDKVMMYI